MERTKSVVLQQRERIRLNIIYLFWIFLIGCVIGTLWEEFLTIIVDHKFESRAGLVYGPFNPVYGIGVVAMTLCLAPLSDRHGSVILLVGALIGGGFEYICSFMQELIFSTVSWDYSNMPLNINGRTTLPYMLFWGIAGLAWVRILPSILGIISRIPHLRFLSAVLAVFMVFNIAVSAMAGIRADERRAGIAPAGKIDQLLDRRFPDERMNRIYPNAIVTVDPAA